MGATYRWQLTVICRLKLRQVPFVVHLLVTLSRCPLHSVAKPDTAEHHFNLDLSWPEGSSVNDGISKDFYLGELVLLTYPTVDDMTNRIVQLGPGCFLFKRDLKCVYRQLLVDPFDNPSLGYSWHDHLFFDVHLPMGLCSASMGCQGVTNAVCFMLSLAGCNVLSYLDDFIGTVFSCV